jgi:hypothetical protein
MLPIAPVWLSRHACCEAVSAQTLTLERKIPMFGPVAAYAVAISAMLFAGISAITLIYAVKHLDPPQAHSSPKAVAEMIAA